MSYPAATYTRHVQSWLDRATPAEYSEGMNWYPRGHAECVALAHEFRIHPRTAAGIVAVLSPGMRWERNIRAARRLILGQPCEAYKANVAKARKILAGDWLDVIQGPKVRAFFALLTDGGNPESLCIDSIAILAALGKNPDQVANRQASQIFRRTKQLEAIRKAYLTCSAQAGIFPCQTQAIVWVTWRNERDKP